MTLDQDVPPKKYPQKGYFSQTIKQVRFRFMGGGHLEGEHVLLRIRWSISRAENSSWQRVREQIKRTNICEFIFTIHIYVKYNTKADSSRNWGCQNYNSLNSGTTLSSEVRCFRSQCGKKRGYIENIAKRFNNIWRTYVIVQLNFVYSQIQESWEEEVFHFRY